MPIIAFRDEEVRPVGTCFAISSQGLVLTARHVIDEALHPTREQAGDEGPWWIGALHTAAPVGESGPNVIGGILPAVTVHINDILDIAIIHLNLPINITTNEMLRVPQLRISPGFPSVSVITRCFGSEQ